MAVQLYDVQDPDGCFVERWWTPVNAPVLDGMTFVPVRHDLYDVAVALPVNSSLSGCVASRGSYSFGEPECEGRLWRSIKTSIAFQP